MLLEIKSVMQRNLERRQRGFHDDYFDLYVWQAPDGQVLEMQLCYERGSKRERALTWKRGIGYAHYMVDSGESKATERQTPILFTGGKFGGWKVREQLVGAVHNLEKPIADFVLDKVAEHCDPPRRFPRRGRSAPGWLRKIRSEAIKRNVENYA